MSDPKFTGACIDTTPRWRRRVREWRHAVAFQIRLLYGRTLYRPHMKLIHRRGWHWWTHMRPMGGPAMDLCQWCGYRRVHHPAPKVGVGPLGYISTSEEGLGG